MIKKIFFAALTSVFLVCLSACSDSNEQAGDNQASESSSSERSSSSSSIIGRKCVKSANPISTTTTYLGEGAGGASVIYSETAVTTSDGSMTQYSLKYTDIAYSWNSMDQNGISVNLPDSSEIDVEAIYQIADHSSVYGKCDNWQIDQALLSLPGDINFP